MNKALIALLLLSGVSQAQDVAKPLDIGGLTSLLSEKIKEAKGATILSIEGKPAAAMYLPVWTFHGQSNDYAEVGIGGQWKSGDRAEAISVLAVNLPALSGKLWDFPWSRAHLTRSPFPPIFFGPTFGAPLDVAEMRRITRANLRNYLGVLVSVRLAR